MTDEPIGDEAQPPAVAEPAVAEPAYATFPRRWMALVVDGCICLAVIVGLGTVAGRFDETPAVRIGLFVLVVLFLLLYDPLFVSRAGGTPGHRALNLRVVADGTGGNLGFGRAIVRTALKGLAGLLAFVSMATTRRHQALHDIASRSTVQIRDIERARPAHYVRERAPVAAGRPSAAVRVAGILCYGAVALLLLTTLAGALVSVDCLEQNVCSAGDDLTFTLYASLVIGGAALIPLLGWTGRLPGFRARPPRPAGSGAPDVA